MFFYLDKNSLTNGSMTVIFQTETAIPNYKEIKNFGELVEYEGEGIPNQWEFDGEHLYDLKEKPSPYHILNKDKEWVVSDEAGFKKYCKERIESLKVEILEYGFDYDIDGVKHRQKCRDKDITFMAITALIMFFVNTFFNKDVSKTWYFEDNFGKTFDLQGLVKMMFIGSAFVQAVYDSENYFKTLPEPKLIKKEEYFQKIKELQSIATEGL